MHAAGYMRNRAGLVWYGNACLQLEFQVTLWVYNKPSALEGVASYSMSEL